MVRWAGSLDRHDSALHQSQRLVLGRTPGIFEVEELAEERGWPRVTDIRDDGEAVRQVGWAVGEDLRLDYIEDPVSLNCYVVAASHEATKVCELVTLVEHELEPWDARRLFLSIATESDPLERARAVMRAGLGAPDDFDERFFTRIRDAMTDPEDWVREAAVWATAYSPWPQYRPLLQDRADHDPVKKIRDDAATLLEGFESSFSSATLALRHLPAME